MPTEHQLMASWNQALAEIIASNFDDSTIKELVTALEQVAQGASSMIIVYPRGKRPHIPYHRLLPEEDPAIHLGQYLDGAYLVDPFYLHAIEAEEGLFSITDVAPEGFKESEYYRIYQHAVDLTDEASFMMRWPGNSIVQISLGRHYGEPSFSSEEKALLKRLFPVVKAILDRWLQTSNAENADQGIDIYLDAALENFGTSLLTKREGEILNLLLRGYAIKPIAQRLNNSAETIKHHRKNIYTKLDVCSQAELFYLFIDSLRSAPLDSNKDPLIAYMSM